MILSQKKIEEIAVAVIREDVYKRQVMIDAMKHELETNFREEYAAGKVYLMAASSSTDEVTEEDVYKRQDIWTTRSG